MTRLILSTILALLMPVVMFAQINWTEHTIDSTFNGAMSVYAIDINGDSAVDVLGAAYEADDITWWENDGNENFTKHTIADNFDGVCSVYAIDLDNDNDIDVLGAAFFADDITWWENDGNENFTKHTIADHFDGASSVYAIDLDNDNDIDVLGAAYEADDITWWENDGSSLPNFTEHTIDSTFSGVMSVYAIDLDNDNDIDILGAACYADDITWWENDGASPPGFTKHTIDSTFSGASSVYAIDLDNDNDIDVLGAASGNNYIAWWENDGNENFTKDTIADNFNAVRSVYAIDLDNDNDIDVLSAACQPTNDITWWENDGASPPDFTEHTIADNFNAAWSVYAIDLDDDNDVDVLGAAAFVANDITWWRSDLMDIYDVGPVSIDIDSLIPEDTTLNPQATVINFSTTGTATFVATCEINPGEYTKTQTVNDLAAGDSVQISFFTEFTFVSGSYIVTVYTRWGSDENTSNDTLEKVIETYDPGIAEGGSVIPTSFSFGLRNNPVNGKAMFNLVLPEQAAVTLCIYDVTGRLIDQVISGKHAAGYHTITWNPEVTAGVYFYSLESPWKTEVGKLVLIR